MALDSAPLHAPWSTLIVKKASPPCTDCVRQAGIVRTRKFSVQGIRPSAHIDTFGAVAVMTLAALTCRVQRRRCRQTGVIPRNGGAAEEVSILEGGRPSFLSRLGDWWRRHKIDKKQLSKMGVLCGFAYGLLSSINAALLITISTYRAMATTGASPLTSSAALKQFGISYAGLYVISNLIRPLRVSLAIALTPAYEKFTQAVQRFFRCERWLAITIIVILTNVVGTCCLLYCGLKLASMSTGVSISFAKVGFLFKAGKAARTSGIA